MIYNVLLISEQKLKDNTPINENVDSSELRFCISQAQTIQIQESLGTNLYEKILELVDTGDIDLPGNFRYKALLDNFIQPTLISFAYMLGLDNFFVKFINIGLVQNRSEQGQPVDLKMLQYLKTNAQQQAQFNNNLLRRHLLFRSSWYPEFLSGPYNNGEIVPQTKTAFNSLITTPGAGYYWYNNRRGFNRNPYGVFCEDSGLPIWYGSPNNSGTIH